jgi:hypothetical protein
MSFDKAEWTCCETRDHPRHLEGDRSVGVGRELLPKKLQRWPKSGIGPQFANSLLSLA